jgi:hypothetical protein
MILEDILDDMSEFHLSCGGSGPDILLSVSPLKGLAKASAS